MARYGTEQEIFNLQKANLCLTNRLQTLDILLDLNRSKENNRYVYQHLVGQYPISIKGVSSLRCVWHKSLFPGAEN